MIKSSIIVNTKGFLFTLDLIYKIEQLQFVYLSYHFVWKLEIILNSIVVGFKYIVLS